MITSFSLFIAKNIWVHAANITYTIAIFIAFFPVISAAVAKMAITVILTRIAIRITPEAGFPAVQVGTALLAVL